MRRIEVRARGCIATETVLEMLEKGVKEVEKKTIGFFENRFVLSGFLYTVIRESDPTFRE